MAAEKQTCVDEHILSLHFLNQKDVPCEIGPNGIEFDYVKCNKCNQPFHHTTYGLVCEKNKDYYLCFKCYPYPKNKVNPNSIASWMLNSNTKKTQIFAKTADVVSDAILELHKLQVNTLLRDDIFVDKKIFKYDLVFTTYLHEYFHFLATDELPTNPIDQRDIIVNEEEHLVNDDNKIVINISV